jgi:hypothetical protein
MNWYWINNRSLSFRHEINEEMLTKPSSNQILINIKLKEINYRKHLLTSFMDVANSYFFDSLNSNPPSKVNIP